MLVAGPSSLAAGLSHKCAPSLAAGLSLVAGQSLAVALSFAAVLSHNFAPSLVAGPSSLSAGLSHKSAPSLAAGLSHKTAFAAGPLLVVGTLLAVALPFVAGLLSLFLIVAVLFRRVVQIVGRAVELSSSFAAAPFHLFAGRAVERSSSVAAAPSLVVGRAVELSSSLAAAPFLLLVGRLKVHRLSLLLHSYRLLIFRVAHYWACGE